MDDLYADLARGDLQTLLEAEATHTEERMIVTTVLQVLWLVLIIPLLLMGFWIAYRMGWDILKDSCPQRPKPERRVIIHHRDCEHSDYPLTAHRQPRT